MLDLVLSIIFAIHLLCANVASAGPLYCIFLQRSASRSGDPWISNVGRRLAFHSINGLLVTTLAGLSIGGLLWVKGDASFFSALPLFWPKIIWGSSEIVFSFVCYGLYWALWPRTIRGTSQALAVVHCFIALLGTTNLLYHFPSLFGAIAYVARHPGQFESAVTSQQFRNLVYSGQILSLTVHFWLASIAVAGMFLMLLSRRSAEESNSQASMSIIRWSARAVLAVTVGQIPVGMWVLLQTDPLQQQSLLGGDILTTSFLGLSVVLTFGLLHLLAAMSLGEFSDRDLRKSALILLAIVIFMTAALRRSRLEYEGVRAGSVVSQSVSEEQARWAL